MSSCGPLASTAGGSVGFSTRRDDPSNREFSSIDNDRWKMSPSTAPPSCSFTRTARMVPLLLPRGYDCEPYHVRICTRGFRSVTIRASEVGHSPPTVGPACPPAGGCKLCSGEPPPAASRSSPCATPAGGFAPAPSAMGRSGCSGATAALPPVASPPNGASGTARPPPCSRGPNAPGRAGAGRAAAPTGYLPIGRSAAAATLGIAKNAAVMRMMIFMILNPAAFGHPAGERRTQR
jgi:hypothetical protein